MAHPGVPNTTLVKEEDPLAQKFKGKSVAEQNSVVLTWNMLMQPEFEDLRFCIYDNEDEFFRFRSIIVNGTSCLVNNCLSFMSLFLDLF